MKTPVSASSPMSAISPTHTAIETLYPSAQSSHTAPTAENGTASITSAALNADFVFMYSSAKMSTSVSGTMSFSRSRTRSMFSYWPLHDMQ